MSDELVIAGHCVYYLEFSFLKVETGLFGSQLVTLLNEFYQFALHSLLIFDDLRQLHPKHLQK